MNRSEAMAPLKAGEARMPVSAGVFIRSSIRQAAVRFMVDFYEEKGVLSSEFIFRAEVKRLLAFKRAMEKALED